MGIEHGALRIGDESLAGSQSGRLRLQGLDERQNLSEYIPSLQAGNEIKQAFGVFLVPFSIGH
ncbi:MAG: hypothetical protein RM347_023135 [Nostoc sp. ChiQUE02]|uniref:hypothetical protein n=1 Tax=Nostoc sp. ChiQUE02 TaxID=3075377 RepID=UPI002AD2B957|nr:hypothetical protein [Nostoc sp. ChiQUE02]